MHLSKASCTIQPLSAQPDRSTVVRARTPSSAHSPHAAPTRPLLLLTLCFLRLTMTASRLAIVLAHPADRSAVQCRLLLSRPALLLAPQLCVTLSSSSSPSLRAPPLPPSCALDVPSSARGLPPPSRSARAEPCSFSLTVVAAAELAPSRPPCSALHAARHPSRPPAASSSSCLCRRRSDSSRLPPRRRAARALLLVLVLLVLVLLVLVLLLLLGRVLVLLVPLLLLLLSRLPLLVLPIRLLLRSRLPARRGTSTWSGAGAGAGHQTGSQRSGGMRCAPHVQMTAGARQGTQRRRPTGGGARCCERAWRQASARAAYLLMNGSNTLMFELLLSESSHPSASCAVARATARATRA